jgi:hypothetical protein
VNPGNTFGKGLSWITAPKFDVAALNDIGIQHEVTISEWLPYRGGTHEGWLNCEVRRRLLNALAVNGSIFSKLNI